MVHFFHPKIKPMDIQDRKITLAGPKSGKESEVVFIPKIDFNFTQITVTNVRSRQT